MIWKRPINSSASCWRHLVSKFISTKSSSISSNSSFASATARRASGLTPLSSCCSPRRSWRRPRPLPHPPRPRTRNQNQRRIPSASKKNGHGRKPLPASLPRKPILHDVPLEQRVCPDCGVERTCIGREVREQLEYVPASMIVLEHIRPKYACRACEGNVVIAERLPEPIEKGLPGPGLMAHVAVSKYADHQPLYRQEGIYKRFGVDLSRSTMCDWMAVAAELLEPIVKLMMSRILTSKVVQNDDTTVPVQDHAGKGIKTGRLWASVGDHYNPYVVYCYTPDHSATGPQEIFKDFKGYLQADACFSLRLSVQIEADHRGRLHDARSTKVLRGEDQRPGTVASSIGVDPIALRHRTRSEKAQSLPITRLLSRCGTSCEKSDRCRSLKSSTPG